MSKYNPLWIYISNQENSVLQLSFLEIQNVLGFPIDHSFLTFKKELVTYGYEVHKISLKEAFVVFKKIQ